MLCEFGAGGLTLTVTVPLAVVRPLSERVTPGIPLVIVSEAELCGDPVDGVLGVRALLRERRLLGQRA